MLSVHEYSHHVVITVLLPVALAQWTYWLQTNKLSSYEVLVAARFKSHKSLILSAAPVVHLTMLNL